VCATLFFYYHNGTEMVDKRMRGQATYYGLNRKAIKNVAYFKQIGTGCYKVFGGKRFNGKSKTLMEHGSMIDHTDKFAIK
jgi:hypothetical protein